MKFLISLTKFCDISAIIPQLAIGGWLSCSVVGDMRLGDALSLSQLSCEEALTAALTSDL